MSTRPLTFALLANTFLSACVSDGNPALLFPPEKQTPLFEKGLILPPNSLACTPEATGKPQNNCNHHGSTVAELPDGTLAAVWYHGEAEKSPDSRLVWSRLPAPPRQAGLSPGARDWAPPEVLYDDPGRAEGNPAIWVSEDGAILVFFVTIFGEGWPQSKIRLVRSIDGGQSWSSPTTLREEFCWMTRHRPARLKNRDLLLPLYIECLALPAFMRSTDNFSTWTEEFAGTGQYLVEHLGQIQPALIAGTDGTLMAITRDGTPTRRIQKMTSRDLGRTWTPSVPLDLPNSGTSVDWVRLLDNHVMVVFNNSPDDRFPLAAALSLDDGETFSAVRHLNDECGKSSCSYSYPSITQSRRDGTVWVTYTHNRETIGYVHFNEAWLMQGGNPANMRPIP